MARNAKKFDVAKDKKDKKEPVKKQCACKRCKSKGDDVLLGIKISGITSKEINAVRNGMKRVCKEAGFDANVLYTMFVKKGETKVFACTIGK